MSEDATTQPDAPSVTLTEAEAEAVADVVVAYVRVVPAERQEPYTELLDQLGTRQVSGTAVATLERVCSVALETGQARRIGMAEVEGLVTAVFRRTPSGSAQVRQLRDINAALEHLKGQVLSSAQISSQRPGRYTLSLGSAGFGVTLVVTPSGVELSNLTTG